MEKPIFSIFLDFDGVLNDLNTIPNLWKFGGIFVKRDDRRVFNKESIVALNTLIDTLENKYDVELILTTFWRRNIDKCREILSNNGLNYMKEVKSLPMIVKSTRSKQVNKY